MNQPKVSVIVPIYKVEAYLEKCLATLVRQSLEEIEILAVNDGSPDSCGEILERWKKEYPEKIRILEKENGGLSDARNYGLARAKGEYIAFLDGDDYVDLDLYDLLYQKAVETGADAVACNINYVWPDGTNQVVSSGIPAFAEGEEIKGVYPHFYPAVWNKIYRREVLLESGVIFKKGALFEDVEFSHRLFPYFHRIASVEQGLIHYVQREGSITAKPDRRLFDYLGNFESILSFFKERNLFPEWEKEVEYAACRYLLATFLKRAGALSDEEFEEALSRSVAFLEQNFPRRKKNPYLWKNGVRGLYLFLFTPTLARLMRKK